MSGIAGIVYPDAYQANNLILPMLKIMSHRGPEKENETFKNIEVGICGGSLAQNENGIVGFDGRLQNRELLKATLASSQHPPLGECDADIVLSAYMVWGKSFLEHLQGDFAFFVLDKRKDRLILGRDRIGKKPLYWYHEQDTFIFASELKSILASGAVPQTPNSEALATYLFFGYIPQDLSPIKSVNKLLPGYYLQLNKNQSKSIQSYWSYSSCFAEKNGEDQETSQNNLSVLLKKSVQNNLPTENSFGCLLSGGLGSSSVAYYSRQIEKEKCIPAFSVGFEGENEQDIHAAQEVAEQFHLKHSCKFITPQNFLDDFVKIVWHLDEPLADPNVISTWHLAALAKPVRTVLSGMGSDELLAGHSRYSVEEGKVTPWQQHKQSILTLIEIGILPILQMIYKPGVYHILQQLRTQPWQLYYLNQNALFTDKLLAKAAPRLSHLFDPHVFLHKFHNLSKIPSRVSSLLYFDVKTRLPDCYILQLERLMTAQGLDWRTPFLSKDLVEYVAKLPELQQQTEGETHSYLKAILKNTLPASVLNRPKRTRKDFLKSWATTPEISDLFDMLPEGALVESGIVSSKWIQRQLVTPYHTRAAFRQLWGILALEVWFRIFINRPIQYQPPAISLVELLKEK